MHSTAKSNRNSRWNENETGSIRSIDDLSAGDLCYYAPWENRSLFYKSFHYSDDLYVIGHVDADMSIFSEIDESFTITFDEA